MKMRSRNRLGTAALIGLLIIVIAGCVEEGKVATPEPETPTETNDEVEIIGDQEFIKQVEAALTLLEDKDPEAFYIVKKYIKRIEQGEHSCMWADKDPPTFELTDRTAFYSVTWCASVIAHDSYHSKLYHDYKSTHSGSVPYDVWIGVEAELQCIAHQLNVAKKIGAPQHEIDYIKTLDGTHHDFNKDGEYDWEDYKERDW